VGAPLEQVREQILREQFPQIADLRNQVHISYWSNYHLIFQPLLNHLPFGWSLGPTTFYQYIDYQFDNLLVEAWRNLLFWSLSGANHFNQTPVTQTTLFFDETFFWHYYIPVCTREITEALLQGNRIRFLSWFCLSQDQIEVEFNEIRLRTTDSRTQLVYCHSKEYTYKWLTALWEVNIIDHKQALVNPANFSWPITEPNTFGRETEYQDHLERILNQPNDFNINAQYWESLDTTEVNSSLSNSSPSLPSLSSRASTLELQLCWCGTDLCLCNNPRPDTPPTPPYIILWKPTALNTQPEIGLHYQHHNTFIQSGSLILLDASTWPWKRIQYLMHSAFYSSKTSWQVHTSGYSPNPSNIASFPGVYNFCYSSSNSGSPTFYPTQDWKWFQFQDPRIKRTALPALPSRSTLPRTRNSHIKPCRTPGVHQPLLIYLRYSPPKNNKPFNHQSPWNNPGPHCIC